MSSFSVGGAESEPVSLLVCVLASVVVAVVVAVVVDVVVAVVLAAVVLAAVVDAAVVGGAVAVFVSEHPVIEKVASITNKVPADRVRAIREENWFENLNL